MTVPSQHEFQYERPPYDGPQPERPPLQPASGPNLFIRYAYPPNERGYCGPADTGSFLAYGQHGQIDPGFLDLARAFTGAWPYLELIAGAAGIADPLDRRVVEAYWVGNALLDRVGPVALGGSMDERFRRTTGRQFSALADGVVAGGVPHHSFHVFCIYPWVGLLGNDRKASQALTVLDRCRIRWGQVQSVTGEQVVLESRPLLYDGHRLSLGEPQREVAQCGIDGTDLARDLRPGDWVTAHWEWVCDRLTEREVATLRRYTLRHLAVVNDGVTQSGAMLALG